MKKHQDEKDILKSHLPSEEDIPAGLQSVVRYYAAQPVPRPSPQDTEHLLMRLLTEEATVALKTSRQQVPSFLRVLRVARWRLYLLGPWFWCISAGLLLLLLIGVPVLGRVYAVEILILLLPLTTILCVVHALRSTSLGLREVEISCPIGVVETTAGLTLAIVGFNVIFGCLATAEIALLHWVPFVALLSAWLAPLLLFTAISLPVALRWGTRAAVLIAGLPWLFLAIIAALNPTSMAAYIIMTPVGNMPLLLHYCSAVLGVSILLGFLIYGSHLRPLSHTSQLRVMK